MVKKNTKPKNTVIPSPAQKATPVTEKKPEKEVEAQEDSKFTGVTSLGTDSCVTIGKNKSGMPWKKSSKRSQFSKGPPISYLKSMEEKTRLKRIRERVQALRDERSKDKKELRRRAKEKAERKKLNEFKSSKYQMVSHTVCSLQTPS